ncbi:MAG: aminomethyltransferase beta-barrel domain-containing protein, partial [Terriglobia bacterium]
SRYAMQTGTKRRGLGVAAGRPLYVVALDRARNRLIVGDERELYRRSAEVADVNWVSIAPPGEPLRAQVRLRHKHTPAPATLYPCAVDGASVRVVFDQPQRAITPGQAGVFYAPAESADAELVLGGGWLR